MSHKPSFLSSLLAALGFRRFRPRLDIEKALRSGEDEHVRQALAALSQLPRIGVDPYLPGLLELARGSEPASQEADGLLRRLFPYQHLLTELRRELPEPARAATVDLLGYLYAQESLAELTEAAASSSTQVRAAAIGGLATLGGEQVIARAVTMLQDPSAELREAGWQILKRMGQEALEALRGGVSAPRWEARLGALRALDVLGERLPSEVLLTLLSDPSPWVRAGSARSLNGREQDAVEALITAIEDPSPHVRTAAAVTLARADVESAREPVADFLERTVADDAQPPDWEFLREVAKMSLPPERFLNVLSAPNEDAAVGMAAALEEAGRVDGWLADPAQEQDPCLVAILTRLCELAVREPFLRSLRLPNPESRARAADLLGESGAAEAVPGLTVALNDPIPAVRASAARALGRLRATEAARPLLTCLSDPDSEVRLATIECLGGMLEELSRLPELFESTIEGEPPRPPDSELHTALASFAEWDMQNPLASSSATLAAELLTCLTDPAPAVRARSAEVVARLEIQGAGNTLAHRAIYDQEPMVRLSAARALGRMETQEGMLTISEALSHPHSSFRVRALEALAELSNSVHLARVTPALDDPDSEVRRAAGRALWALADHDTAAGLVDHIHHPDPRVRSAVVGMVGRLRMTSAVEAVANRLDDPQPRVRAAALNALRMMPEAARPHLSRMANLLEDPDPYLRAVAAEVIALVGSAGQEELQRLLAMMDDEQPEVKESATRALSKLACNGAPEQLVEALTSNGRLARGEQVLMSLDLEALRPLLAAARTGREVGHRLLLEAISRVLAARTPVEQCRRDLLSLDPSLRLAGLEALSLMKTPEAVALLIEVYRNDPLPSIRERAAAMLAESGDPVALAAVSMDR